VRCVTRFTLVLHSFDRGGSGKVAGYLARGFADMGLQVGVLVLARGGAVEDIAMAHVGPDVPVRFLGRLSGWRPLDMLLGIPALVRALRRERPEIVLAAANNIALVTALAFRLAAVPGSRLYLKTTNPVASSRHRGLVRWLRRLGYRAIFPWTTGVLTLTSEESAEMVAAFPAFGELFQDVANPYVTAAMLAPAPVVRPGPKTVIVVARLARQKRLERLIDAFAHVATPGARLLILGEGEERAGLAARVAQLGLRHRVEMPGHVGDVTPALQAADLFVLTSDYEGLPAAVLEAMAANCPVLSTPCFPGARRLLAAEGCAVIADTDPRMLAAQIDAGLRQPRPQALRAVAQRYSIPAAVASHAAALMRIKPVRGVCISGATEVSGGVDVEGTAHAKRPHRAASRRSAADG